MENKEKMRGKKYYGVVCRLEGTVLGPFMNLEDAEEKTDSKWDTIVEMTVTKIWEKNPAIIEIK